ncbi:exosortase-associated EpsI family protein [Acidobacteria bacterium AH-259-A15]|nr:exosortase-associated EpsI family protein [Acidobacteria bacterium AH-259-A15]
MMAYSLFKLFRKKPRVVVYFSLVALWLGPLEAKGITHHASFTDTNPYYFTSHQGKWYTQTDLFHENNMAHLPMVLGDWEGEDVPISDVLPVFLRLYEHRETGAGIFIQPVYGEEESAFHTAEVCYIDDGWRLEQRGFKTLMINGQSLPVRYVTAKTGEHRHHIFYWYVWPDTRRVITDGALMIRLSIEMEEGGESDAERAAVDFIEKLSLASFGSERRIQVQLPNPDVSAWKKELRRRKKHYPKLSPKLTEARHRVENWLLNQMVPNIVVRRPAYARRNLVLSYETDPSHPDYQYTFSKSALYDNALAAIAFTMMGKQDRASAVLDALSRVLNKHWDLFFSFNTHNTWPSDQDSYGAIVRTGASAWVGYALCFYLARELLDDPDLFRENPDAVRYLQLAERIGERLLVRQVTEEGDPRQGLLTGGEGSYVLRLKGGKVVEEYVPGEVTWSSVEHNIDSYFFYRALGRLTGNKKWSKAASKIQEALLRAAWNPENSQFNRGVSKLERDLVQALDCASWGSLVLKSWGEDKKATQALTTFDKYQSEHDGIVGYRPYAEGPIYDSFAIQKHFYPDKKKGVWENLDFVWPEGSLGVGLAYFRQGRREKAEQILQGMLQLQGKNGGISYATKDIPFQFSTAPSVASNAWWIILASTLEDPLLDVLFLGP